MKKSAGAKTARTAKAAAREKRRNVERQLFQALIDEHHYLVFDSLKERDRETTIIDFTKINNNRQTGHARRGIAIKLVVRDNTWMGREILKLRKERDPATSANAKLRAKRAAKAVRS